MALYRTYFRRLYDIIEHMVGTQGSKIEQAADWLATSLGDGGVAHIFGSGHSHMVAEEVFHRAGSLLPLNPMLDPNLTFLGQVNATLLERTAGYGPVIVDTHDIRAGEVVIVVSNSGVNPVPVEVALRAKERGAKTISICSDHQYKDAPSRAPGGQRLAEVTDLTIDTYVPRGDALIDIPGLEAQAGGASSVVGIAIINAIVVETAGIMAKRGLTPPVIPSMNVPGGDEKMEKLIEQYGDRLPLLKHA